MRFQKDSLYANPLGEIASFKFDDAVVDVFPDMIQRSVPGYSTIISAIGLLAGQFCQENSVCYDLGCSLGAASLAMQAQIIAPNCQIIAVDSSESMVRQFQLGLDQNVNQDSPGIKVICADIRGVAIKRASIVVLNFTLQFIPNCDREALITKIYQGLLPGGVLILSEKMAFTDMRQQLLQEQMHHHFKRMQGYSEMEISQKRTALENVLVAETFAVHQARILKAGFTSVELWFQYFNFASMIALK